LYKESRELFKSPDVITDKAQLEELIKWNKPDEEALKSFLVNEKSFTEQKVESGLKKLGSA
jgi:flap endonuclease-1